MNGKEIVFVLSINPLVTCVGLGCTRQDKPKQDTTRRIRVGVRVGVGDGDEWERNFVLQNSAILCKLRLFFSMQVTIYLDPGKFC